MHVKELTLTQCQEAGLFRISMSDEHVIICGPAGTGKTTLMRKIVDIFPSKRVVYCAPTHAAKEVIQEATNDDAYTIHAILGISPDTYEDEVKFSQSAVPDLSEIDILVVDESSMLDGELFDIMLRSVPRGCRIIGLGDPYQLQPPKNDPGILSPIFFDERFIRIILKEIVRQGADSPIIQVATAIRKEAKVPYQCVHEERSDEGVFIHSNLSMFLKEYWKYVKTPEDTLKYKLVSYKNSTVNRFNAVIRQKLYNTTEPFVKGEYLVMQEPVYRELKAKGLVVSELVFHNGETIQILDDGTESIQQVTETVKLERYDGLDPVKIKYHTLNVRNKKGDQIYKINVFDDDSYRAELDLYMSYAAIHYKRMSRTGASKTMMRNLWDAWWMLKNKFKDVKGSAACTVHKSQGSTYEGVFYVRNGLDTADEKVRRQLDYVAVTRAKKFVHSIA